VPLTGPESLTNSDLADVIGTILGRELTYVEAPEDAVRGHFSSIGLPGEFADAYLALLGRTLDCPALVTRDVEEILGRPACTFRQWVSENSDRFTE
jgi:uncharacterized protein YbjT (DUF2867 family)